MVFLAGVVAAVTGAAIGQSSIYHDHHMVLVTVSTPEQLEAVDNLGVNLACREGLGIQRLVVSPDNLAALQALNLPTITISDNVQAIIDAEATELANLRNQRDATFFTVYRRTGEISNFIDDLHTMVPTIATRFAVGNSVQGLPIFGVKITAPGGGSKPKVVINACQHAREWISPMTACWAAEQLALGYGVDSEITALLNAVEIHIIPVVNPDGYEYTYDLDRYWRKNRKVNGGGSIGVDLNRNWAYQFGGTGSSASPSNETYRGLSAFSEAETAALSAYITSLAGSVTCFGDCAAGNRCSGVRAHLDIHTFAALVLGPWSYSLTVPPPRDEILRIVQTEQNNALVGAHGYPYQAGLGIDDLLYAAAGVAPDWTFAQYGSLAWTYELRPADGGLEGFDPPPSEIVPACEETFQGILALVRRVAVPRIDTLWTNLPKTLEAPTSTAEVRVAAVYDECGPAPTARLFRRAVGGSSFTQDPMGQSGNQFFVNLSAGPCGAAIEYYVELSVAGNPAVTRIPASAGTYITATSRNPVAVFTDNFQTNLAWAVTNTSLTDGAWVRGVPVSPVPPGAPAADADGSGQCYVTDNASTASDVDGGSTTLTSPVMDATNANSYIEYARWYSNRVGANPNHDTFTVQVSDNNGTSWKALEIVGPAGPENNGGWIRRSFKVSDIPAMTNTAQFRIRFVASDPAPAANVEAAVDAVRLVVYSCPAVVCAGDINGDGSTNISDFNILASHFGQFVEPHTGGDINSSGRVDVNDFNILVGNFGCHP